MNIRQYYIVWLLHKILNSVSIWRAIMCIFGKLRQLRHKLQTMLVDSWNTAIYGVTIIKLNITRILWSTLRKGHIAPHSLSFPGHCIPVPLLYVFKTMGHCIRWITWVTLHVLSIVEHNQLGTKFAQPLVKRRSSGCWLTVFNSHRHWSTVVGNLYSSHPETHRSKRL